MDSANPPAPNLPLDAELRRELAAGEHLLWQGTPDPKKMLVVLVMWLFAIPWTLFSLAWTGLAFTAYWSGLSTQPEIAWWGWIFPLFGTPFIAVGFWMLNQPLNILARARSTVHALTDRRLITLQVGKHREVKSVAIQQLGPVSVKEKRGGWGDLSAETGSHIDSDGDRVTDRFEMVSVPDVARLHRLLMDTMQRH
jgi:hypothetical protein